MRFGNRRGRMKTLAAAQDRAEIRVRLERFTASQQRLWGKMTAHGMICHLADAFRHPLGEKTASDSRPALPRGFYKWVALRTPTKWPRGVPTRPEMEQGVGGSSPTEFDGDRRELLQLMERFAQPSAADRPAHPIFGRMTEEEWMRWGYLHVDHHLRQFGG
jgi:Protein of unknown function (DUF1569)